MIFIKLIKRLFYVVVLEVEVVFQFMFFFHLVFSKCIIGDVFFCEVSQAIYPLLLTSNLRYKDQEGLTPASNLRRKGEEYSSPAGVGKV